MFRPADFLSVSLFVIFCTVQTALICYAVWKAGYAFRRFLAIFIGYLLVFSVVAASGLPIQHIFPVFPLMLASVIIGALLFGLSVYGKKVAGAFSFGALIGFQGF